MKTIYVFFLNLLFGISINILNAQIVNIPDANMKARILSSTTFNSIAFDAAGNPMAVDTDMDGEIQVSEALNVFGLNIAQSGILNTTGLEEFVNLTYLDVNWNQITTIDLSSLVDLKELYAHSNLLEEIDLSTNTQLEILHLNNNELIMLDLSNNPTVHDLHFYNNSIVYLNLKNGTLMDFSLSDIWDMNFSTIQDYSYICADEFEVDAILDAISTTPDAPIGTEVSHYCSFFPGGDYNTITGTVQFDSNNDGVCTASDGVFPNIRVGVNSGATFTNVDGEYVFYTQEGTFNLVPEIENPSFFTIDPISTTVNFPIVDNSVETRNFCIKPNGTHPDLEIVVGSILARPGFQANGSVLVKNKGNLAMEVPNGIVLSYEEDYMDFVSSTEPADTSTPGQLKWDLEELLPFESRTIYYRMQINPPTHPTFPVNIDDVLTFIGNVYPIATDEVPTDNTFVRNQIVVGSFDPNDITCLQGDVVSTDYIGEYLHYEIRFENTGTFYAENIVVVMDIDPLQYDAGSLQLLGSSHPVEARIVGNVAEFYFNAIHLDSGGHGNVLLKIKTDHALNLGDLVSSQVDIYFDYNYPITTNEAETIFDIVMEFDEPTSANLKIYPNPTSNFIQIESDTKIKTIEIYDLTGKLIKKSLVNELQSKQDLKYLSKGVYVIKVETLNGVINGKIIKN